MQSVRWRVAGNRAQLEPVAAVCLCVSFGDGLGGGIGEERLDGVAAHVARIHTGGDHDPIGRAQRSRECERVAAGLTAVVSDQDLAVHGLGSFVELRNILERTAPRAIRVNPHTLCGLCRSPG